MGRGAELSFPAFESHFKNITTLYGNQVRGARVARGGRGARVARGARGGRGASGARLGVNCVCFEGGREFAGLQSGGE